MNQNTLKQYIHYDPNTGIFTWIKNSGNAKAGNKAGCFYKVGSSTYLRLEVRRNQMDGHQAAFLYMKGFIPSEIDHINGNGKDNRWTNLRAATRTINQRNAKKQVNNTSGITGVSWNKRTKYWHAKIGYGHKTKAYVKTFKDFFEACCWRLSMQNKLPHYTKRHGRD